MPPEWLETLGLRETFLPRYWFWFFIAVPTMIVLVQRLRSAGALPTRIGPVPGGFPDLPANPVLFGLVAFLIGAIGTLFAGLTFFQKLVIVAPIFEENAKFGAAVIVLGVLRLRDTPSILALGFIAGACFGFLEHHVSYSTESDLQLVGRTLFHGFSAGLSVMVLVAFYRTFPGHISVRWLSTVPSIAVHSINNLGALLLALVALVFSLFGFTLTVPPFMLFLVALLVGLIVWVIRDPYFVAIAFVRLLEKARAKKAKDSYESTISGRTVGAKVGERSKVTAGVLGILLGGLGAHKFYLGQVGLGILYLLFFWTFIPAIIGLIEGIIYLTMSDEEFARKYGGGAGAAPVRARMCPSCGMQVDANFNVCPHCGKVFPRAPSTPPVA